MLYSVERRPRRPGVGAEALVLVELGVALAGDDEQRTERRAQHEPVRHRHVDGDGAGGGAQHEPGRDHHEVDHRDLLEHDAVADRQHDVGADDRNRLPSTGERRDPERSGEEHDADEAGGGDRDRRRPRSVGCASSGAPGRTRRRARRSRSTCRWRRGRTPRTRATPWQRLGASSSTPAAPGAANTSTFFSHCLGRPVRRSPAIIGASSFRRRHASDRGRRPDGMVGRTEQLPIAGRVAVGPQHHAAAAAFDALAAEQPLVQPLVEPAQLLGATAVLAGERPGVRPARSLASCVANTASTPSVRPSTSRYNWYDAETSTTVWPCWRCQDNRAEVSSRSHRSISAPNAAATGSTLATERPPKATAVAIDFRRSRSRRSRRGDHRRRPPGETEHQPSPPSRHRNGTTQSRRVRVPSTSNATTTGLSGTSDHPARRRCDRAAT